MKQSKHLKTYEVALPGFDGSTDDQFHLVLWVGTDAAEGASFKVFSQVLFNIYRVTMCGEVESNLVDYNLPEDWEELKEYIAKHSIPC